MSSNIPVHQLVAEFLGKSIPHAQQLFCISQYGNGAIQIHTLEGEYKENFPKTLAHFLEKGNSGWYSISETPFSVQTTIGQTSLEMELKRDYLFLKNITFENAKLHLLIQLRPTGPSKNQHLLADQKKQFEQTIRGTVTQLLTLISNDKVVLKNIAKGNTITRNEIKEAKAQLSKQGKNFEIAVTQFIQLIVNKLEEKYGITIRMSHDFIEELKYYHEPFENLEPNLEKHIQIEMNLVMVQGESEILLTPTHLISLKSTKAQVIQNEESDLSLGRFAKTFKLLDRYEAAAEVAQNNGFSIIGKNIGNHCIPSVSNASITDALNKQAKKVYELFSKYPNKWHIIRSEFKSVANIIAKETERRQNIA